MRIGYSPRRGRIYVPAKPMDILKPFNNAELGELFKEKYHLEKKFKRYPISHTGTNIRTYTPE